MYDVISCFALRMSHYASSEPLIFTLSAFLKKRKTDFVAHLAIELYFWIVATFSILFFSNHFSIFHSLFPSMFLLIPSTLIACFRMKFKQIVQTFAVKITAMHLFETHCVYFMCTESDSVGMNWSRNGSRKATNMPTILETINKLLTIRTHNNIDSNRETIKTSVRNQVLVFVCAVRDLVFRVHK